MQNTERKSKNMERFTNSINASIGSGNWLVALFLALALPDIRIHRNSFNGVLKLSIDEFCKDNAKAVMRWWGDVQNNPDVMTRARELIKICGLDDSELPIVHYGKP